MRAFLVVTGDRLMSDFANSLSDAKSRPFKTPLVFPRAGDLPRESIPAGARNFDLG